MRKERASTAPAFDRCSRCRSRRRSHRHRSNTTDRRFIRPHRQSRTPPRWQAVSGMTRSRSRQSTQSSTRSFQRSRGIGRRGRHRSAVHSSKPAARDRSRSPLRGQREYSAAGSKQVNCKIERDPSQDSECSCGTRPSSPEEVPGGKRTPPPYVQKATEALLSNKLRQGQDTKAQNEKQQGGKGVESVGKETMNACDACSDLSVTGLLDTILDLTKSPDKEKKEFERGQQKEMDKPQSRNTEHQQYTGTRAELQKKGQLQQALKDGPSISCQSRGGLLLRSPILLLALRDKSKRIKQGFKELDERFKKTFPHAVAANSKHCRKGSRDNVQGKEAKRDHQDQPKSLLPSTDPDQLEELRNGLKSLNENFEMLTEGLNTLYESELQSQLQQATEPQSGRSPPHLVHKETGMREYRNSRKRSPPQTPTSMFSSPKQEYMESMDEDSLNHTNMHTSAKVLHGNRTSTGYEFVQEPRARRDYKDDQLKSMKTKHTFLPLTPPRNREMQRSMPIIQPQKLPQKQLMQKDMPVSPLWRPTQKQETQQPESCTNMTRESKADQQSSSPPPMKDSRRIVSRKPPRIKSPFYRFTSPPSKAENPPHTNKCPPCKTKSPPRTSKSPPSKTENPPHTNKNPLCKTENPPHTMKSPLSKTENPPHTRKSPLYKTENPPQTSKSPPLKTKSSPYTSKIIKSPAITYCEDLKGEQMLGSKPVPYSPSMNKSSPDTSKSPPPKNKTPPRASRSPSVKNKSPPHTSKSPPVINRSPPCTNKSLPPKNKSPPRATKTSNSPPRNICNEKTEQKKGIYEFARALKHAASPVHNHFWGRCEECDCTDKVEESKVPRSGQGQDSSQTLKTPPRKEAGKHVPRSLLQDCDMKEPEKEKKMPPSKQAVKRGPSSPLQACEMEDGGKGKTTPPPKEAAKRAPRRAFVDCEMEDARKGKTTPPPKEAAKRTPRRAAQDCEMEDAGKGKTTPPPKEAAKRTPRRALQDCEMEDAGKGKTTPPPKEAVNRASRRALQHCEMEDAWKGKTPPPPKEAANRAPRRALQDCEMEDAGKGKTTPPPKEAANRAPGRALQDCEMEDAWKGKTTPPPKEAANRAPRRPLQHCEMEDAGKGKTTPPPKEAANRAPGRALQHCEMEDAGKGKTTPPQKEAAKRPPRRPLHDCEMEEAEKELKKGLYQHLVKNKQQTITAYQIPKDSICQCDSGSASPKCCESDEDLSRLP